MSETDFMDTVCKALKQSGESSSFVFIHGFNVEFDDAARRTAQITFDLDFKGAPIFYSWPSEGTLREYFVDGESAEWSAEHLAAFLRLHAETSGARNIHLIAHSMGSRVLVGALRRTFEMQPDLSGRIRSVILAAPDIDAAIFQRDHVPMLRKGCEQVTLYVSGSDKAMVASRGVHGYPRAGDASKGVLVAPGIETIDSTGVDTSFLAHSYFAESRTLLDDMRSIILDGMRAASRGLTAQALASGSVYWNFPASASPSGPALP